MTYEAKVQAVISKLDSDGADSEREWAENILRSIGITEQTPDGIQTITPGVVPSYFQPRPPSDSNQDAIEANAERNV
jgi:hypothetical protein